MAKRFKRKYRGTNPWGTTEQYNTRRQHASAATLGDILPDPKVQAVYNQCKNMNSWYPEPDNPWEVDHREDLPA